MTPDDVVATLREYCTFGEDRVYLLVAIAREKENPRLTSASEVVVRDVVEDRQDVRRTYDQVRCSAEAYRTDDGASLTFRLYITTNARNTLDAYFTFRERMNGWVKDRIRGDVAASEKFKRLDSYWMSELQKPAARDEKRLLFDVDDDSEAAQQTLRSALTEDTTVLTWRKTPNGYHAITEPFNYTDLDVAVDYEVKTDGLLFVTILTQEMQPAR